MTAATCPTCGQIVQVDLWTCIPFEDGVQCANVDPRHRRRFHGGNDAPPRAHLLAAAVLAATARQS